jgi:hypothetical protein
VLVRRSVCEITKLVNGDLAWEILQEFPRLAVARFPLLMLETR